MPQSAKISIEVDGKDEFNRVFTRLDANFDDLSPIWPEVRDKFYEIEKAQFDSEGGKGASGKWQELTERYAAQKIDRYGAGKKILEATGDLEASLTGDNAGSYYWSNKTEIAVGSTIPYGIYHQRGSEKLPARPPISFADDSKRDLMKTIQSELIKQLRRGRYYVPVSERSF